MGGSSGAGGSASGNAKSGLRGGAARGGGGGGGAWHDLLVDDHDPLGTALYGRGAGSGLGALLQDYSAPFVHQGRGGGGSVDDDDDGGVGDEDEDDGDHSGAPQSPLLHHPFAVIVGILDLAGIAATLVMIALVTFPDFCATLVRGSPMPTQT